jgi:tetratricopeptide (TPR) repeat protein
VEHLPSPAGNPLPRQFGRYRIERLLGRGGMGAVYLAFDTQLKRRVALKAPFVGPDDGPEALRRFRRSAEAVAPLRHGNICGVLDAGEIDGVVYLTMAYIEGRTLAARLADGWRPTAGQAAALVRKLALALDYAHRQGVVHRDVKPSNVLIDERGEPVLIDFGLARSLGRETRLTRSRALIGTPAYLAPEQVEKGAASPLGDLYSLGVVLYELLAGKLPFQGTEEEPPNEAVLYVRLLSPTPHPPPSAHRPGLDPRLEAVCLKAVAKDPAERYPDMAAFADALAPFADDGFPAEFTRAPALTPVTPPPGDESWSLPLSLSGEGVPPPAPQPAPPAPRRAGAWPWGVAAVVAALTLTGAVIGACFHFIPRSAPPGADPGTGMRTGAPPPAPTPEGDAPPAEANPPPPPPAETAARPFRLGTEALGRCDYARADACFSEAVRLDPRDARAFYYRGRVRAAGREYDEAVADFNAALKIDPDYAEAYWGRAAAYLARNDCDEAARDAAEALRRRPAFPQALLVRGRAYHRQGKDDLASADYALAQRLFAKDDALTAPVFALDWADRSEFDRQVDQFPKAVDDAQTAVRLDPACPAGYLRLGEAYHDLGLREEEVAAYADGWKACRADDAAGEVERAHMALELGKAKDAVEACDAALRRDPNASDAFAVRARAWGRLGDRARSLADYARAAQAPAPRWARDYAERASLHYSAEQYDLALSDADRAAELAPRLPVALRLRAEAFGAKNDRARAKADYRQALAVLAPRRARDFADRAWLFNELGAYEGGRADYDAAAADGERALQRGLKSEEVREELAYAYYHGGDCEKAGRAFDEAIRLAPDKAALYRYRGFMATRKGDDAAAVEDCTRALALDPNDAAALNARGAAYVRQGRYEEAEADCTAAIALAPNRPAYYLDRAWNRIRWGGEERLRSAVGDCDKAVGLTPEADHDRLATAFNRRGLAYDGLKDYAKAVADYTEAIRHAPKDPVLYRNRAGAYRNNGDADGADADDKKAEELEAAGP